MGLTVLKPLDNLEFPTHQARETRAPWTETSVYHSYFLLLKLDKLGFQPSKQGRQELRGLILQSILDLNLVLKLDKLGFQPSKQGRHQLPGLILQSIIDETYY